jgi:hypothetical protein
MKQLVERCPSIRKPLYQFRKDWFKVASGTDGLTDTITCLRVDMMISYFHVCGDVDIGARAVAYRGGVWGVQTPPKFRSFDRVEPDCKLSGKCLVLLFQHLN